mmetsp:Transcript_12369/g.18759  ORF Transcript_12369/g.18759 Transcript_12369/m.18759 type:complete len:905 (+) Transcript_12369:100-2814(+)
MSKTVGNYILISKLGSGSYAHVYKAIHNKTNVEYAIKVISREKIESIKLQENLNSEITIMRDYNHMNIIHLYECFTSNRHIYLVLEYCGGGDLQRYIRSYSRLEERVVRRFLVQLAQGLKFLHQMNIIHRDIKPQNLLMTDTTPQAVLKYADFGFAKNLQEAGMAETLCGTPLYMAPEIFEMKKYDAKADLWSVGCVLYEMLVGSPPFKGQNKRELFLNIRLKKLHIPSDISVSPDMLKLLQRLLEINPRKRISLEVFCEIADHMFAEVAPEGDPMHASQRTEVGAVSSSALPSTPTPTPIGRGSPQPDLSAGGDVKSESQSRVPPPPLITCDTSPTSTTTTGAPIRRVRSREQIGSNSPSSLYPHLLSSSPTGHQPGSGSNMQNSSSPRPSGMTPATTTMVMALATGGNQQSPQGQCPSSGVQGSLRRTGSGGRQRDDEMHTVTPSMSPTSTNKHERRHSANDAGAVAKALSITPLEQQNDSKPEPLSRAWELSEWNSKTYSPVQTVSHGHGAITLGLSGPISCQSQDTSPAPATSLGRGERDGNTGEDGIEEEGAGTGGDSDDFVLVEQSPSHPWKVIDADSSSTPKPAWRGTVGDKPSSSSPNTSVGGGVGSPSTHWYGAGGPNNTSGIATGNGSENNDLMHLSAVVHQCSYVITIVMAITSAADEMTRDAMAHRVKREHRRFGSKHTTTGRDDDSSSIGSGSSIGTSSRHRLGSGDATHFSELLAAPFSLYLHALGFVQDTLKRTAAIRQFIPPQSSFRPQIDTLFEGLTKRFDQLLHRAESCRKFINPDDGVPVPEPLIYEAALRLGLEASVEELLGNLTTACERYNTAQLLIECVLMTASDPSDRRVLQGFAQMFSDQYSQCEKSKIALSNDSEQKAHSPGSASSVESSMSRHRTSSL